MKITVCRGTKSKAEEAPNAFFLAERRLPVAAVLNRWTDLPYHFFEVRVDGRPPLRAAPGAFPGALGAGRRT